MRFLLVDAIISLEPGHSITASKRMLGNEELFLDHFPGFQVVPGVLLVEMMAQAAGKCLVAAGSDRGWPMLAQIKSANFRGWVRPDENAIISAEIRQNRRSFATASCSLQVNGAGVASADLLFSFVPRDHFAPGYTDTVLATFLTEHPECLPVGSE